MEILKTAILGAVQGLTEFLPVSSSGHLALFQYLFKMKDPMLAFDIAVHWATLLAVLIYFRRDIAGLTGHTFSFLMGLVKGQRPGDLLNRFPGARVAGLIIITSVPTGLMGIFLEDKIESLFQALFFLGLFWFIMGFVLTLSSRLTASAVRSLDALNFRDAFLIGVAQGIAILPGVSRSGLTICAALWFGIEKKAAARYSFLAGIPAILGAGLLKLKDGMDFFQDKPLELATGFFVAFVIGYAAIAFFLNFIQRDKLHWFGYYNWIMSAVVVVILFLEKLV